MYIILIFKTIEQDVLIKALESVEGSNLPSFGSPEILKLLLITLIQSVLHKISIVIMAHD